MNNMDYTVNETKNIAIEYPLPNRGKRLLANFIDILCLALMAIGFFFAFYGVTTKTPVFTQAQTQMKNLKTDEKVAIYDKDGVALIDQPIEGENNRIEKYEEALAKFYSANNTVVFPHQDGKENDTGKKYYDNRRQLAKTKGQEMFINVGTEDEPIYAHVTEVYEKNRCAYITFYEGLINEAAGLLVQTPTYLKATSVVYWSLAITFLLAYTLSFVIVFLVIPLCFHRGYKTLGMLVTHLGLVYVDGLIPTNGRFVLRFITMFFLEGLLSFVTIGVPFIISGIMAYGNRNGESLHDYLVNTYLVDVTKGQLFYTPGEYVSYAKDQQEKGLPINPGGLSPEQAETQHHKI